MFLFNSVDVRAGVANRYDFVVTRSIRQIISHPRYSSRIRSEIAMFSIINDIALLELSSPLTYSENIQPICLPAREHNDISFRQCWVTGWGQVQEIRGELTNENKLLFI